MSWTALMATPKKIIQDKIKFVHEQRTIDREYDDEDDSDEESGEYDA